MLQSNVWSHHERGRQRSDAEFDVPIEQLLRGLDRRQCGHGPLASILLMFSLRRRLPRFQRLLRRRIRC